MRSATSRQPGPADAGDLTRLRAASGGDVGAYAEIVESRLPAAFGLASAIVGDHEAADATRDAFVAAWRELPRLGDPREFDAWFGRILVGECRMRARRRSSTGVDRVAGAAARARLEAAGGRSMLDEATVLDILDDRFDQLDPDDRAMLALQYLDGLAAAEIGAALHLPPGTVKWRLHEARRALGTALESV